MKTTNERAAEYLTKRFGEQVHVAGEGVNATFGFVRNGCFERCAYFQQLGVHTGKLMVMGDGEPAPTDFEPKISDEGFVNRMPHLEPFRFPMNMTHTAAQKYREQVVYECTAWLAMNAHEFKPEYLAGEMAKGLLE